jgi:hypothetical protein
MATKTGAAAEPVDLKHEVEVIDVSDVDRAKAFYESLGWLLEETRTRRPGREWTSSLV